MDQTDRNLPRWSCFSGISKGASLFRYGSQLAGCLPREGHGRSGVAMTEVQAAQAVTSSCPSKGSMRTRLWEIATSLVCVALAWGLVVSITGRHLFESSLTQEQAAAQAACFTGELTTNESAAGGWRAWLQVQAVATTPTATSAIPTPTLASPFPTTTGVATSTATATVTPLPTATGKPTSTATLTPTLPSVPTSTATAAVTPAPTATTATPTPMIPSIITRTATATQTPILTEGPMATPTKAPPTIGETPLRPESLTVTATQAPPKATATRMPTVPILRQVPPVATPTLTPTAARSFLNIPLGMLTTSLGGALALGLLALWLYRSLLRPPRER